MLVSAHTLNTRYKMRYIYSKVHHKRHYTDAREADLVFAPGGANLLSTNVRLKGRAESFCGEGCPSSHKGSLGYHPGNSFFITCKLGHVSHSE